MTTKLKPLPDLKPSEEPKRRADDGARRRILDAAEWIFAHHGAQALSMRAITARAAINVAGVHYYFGSKEGLILELVRRRFAPINAQRIALLDAAISGSAPHPPSLEAIVDAFIGPMLRIGESVAADHDDTVRRFVGRVAFMPPDVTENAFEELFQPLVRRFHDALRTTLPGLDRGEIFWRMHLSVGPLLRVLAQGAELSRISGGVCRDEAIGQVQRRLRNYICAGLRFPESPGDARDFPAISASTAAPAVS